MSRLLSLLHLAVGLIAILDHSQSGQEEHPFGSPCPRTGDSASPSATLGIATAAHYVFAAFTRPDQAPAAEAPHIAALVLVLLPVAVFFWLRAEAYLDGPGDRFHEGRPGWITLLPSVVACGAGAVLVAAWMNPPLSGYGSHDVALRWLGVLPTILVARRRWPLAGHSCGASKPGERCSAAGRCPASR